MKLRTKLFTAGIIVIFALSFMSNFLISRKISALSGNDFNPGRIIDDAVFFNPNAMNPGDIQAFLTAKVPVCDTNGSQPYGSTTRGAYGTSQGYPPPYICLKDYSQPVPAMAADAYCGNVRATTSSSAAQIIYDVSQACGVSPKILLILLQKEQSLITDDWPWPVQYEKATGYSCPDTAPCDPEFAGLFRQLYYGARQYQRYVKQSHLFNYKAGQTSFIQYNPNAGCGGTNVFIQNQATAGLYNYTPYQPNQAALNDLYGSGDHYPGGAYCSAFGNRNFWRMYIDWFGSPLSPVPFAWSYEGQWAYSDAARTQAFTSTPTVTPGGTIYMRVKARNMGTQPWDKSFLHLGTSRPMDRTSQFAAGGWLSNTRPAELIENTVPPGQIGTFEFAMKAPATAGTYNEYFNVLAEGQTWLNDLGLFFTINVNNPGTINNSNKTVLNSGETLTKDQFLLSPDSQSVFTLQRDGNLVLYTNFQARWLTGVLSSATDRLVMQPDGNLVLYNQTGGALWNTETYGNPGARLVLQTDGNLVLYNSSNAVLWASYTTHHPDLASYINTTLPTGRLYPGQQLLTADRKYKVILQPDGNLVLYSPTRALWATGTNGKAVAFLAMQGDGNLVLYDSGARPLWYSGTSGHGLLRLITQPDGNLVLYNSMNVPLWNTGTAGAL